MNLHFNLNNGFRIVVQCYNGPVYDIIKFKTTILHMFTYIKSGPFLVHGDIANLNDNVINTLELAQKNNLTIFDTSKKIPSLADLYRVSKKMLFIYDI